jgi:hypothetical protein
MEWVREFYSRTGAWWGGAEARRRIAGDWLRPGGVALLDVLQPVRLGDGTA